MIIFDIVKQARIYHVNKMPIVNEAYLSADLKGENENEMLRVLGYLADRPDDVMRVELEKKLKIALTAFEKSEMDEELDKEECEELQQNSKDLSAECEEMLDELDFAKLSGKLDAQTYAYKAGAISGIKSTADKWARDLRKIIKNL